jgi:hypothetical protein
MNSTPSRFRLAATTSITRMVVLPVQGYAPRVLRRLIAAQHETPPPMIQKEKCCV